MSDTEADADEPTAGKDDPEAGTAEDDAEGAETNNDADSDAETDVDVDDDGSRAEEQTDDAVAAEGEAGTDAVVDDASLADRVAEYDDDLAAEVRELAERVVELETELEAKTEEVEELTSRLKRTKADFQNYKKRQEKRREQQKARATEDLVERLLPVRDNLERALEQDDDADIRGGIETTLSELDRVLDEEGVEAIEPEPGDEVDPHVHEVMLRVDSDRPEGTVAELYRTGYRIGDSVVREAQVTVSDGPEDDETATGADGAESGGEDRTAEGDDATDAVDTADDTTDIDAEDDTTSVETDDDRTDVDADDDRTDVDTDDDPAED